MITDLNSFASVDLDRRHRLINALSPMFKLIDDGKIAAIAVEYDGTAGAWGAEKAFGLVSMFNDNLGDGPFAFRVETVRYLPALQSVLLLNEDETPRPEVIRWILDLALAGHHVAIVETTKAAIGRWRNALAPEQVIGG